MSNVSLRHSARGRMIVLIKSCTATKAFVGGPMTNLSSLYLTMLKLVRSDSGTKSHHFQHEKEYISSPWISAEGHHLSCFVALLKLQKIPHAITKYTYGQARTAAIPGTVISHLAYAKSLAFAGFKYVGPSRHSSLDFWNCPGFPGSNDTKTLYAWNFEENEVLGIIRMAIWTRRLKGLGIRGVRTSDHGTSNI